MGQFTPVIETLHDFEKRAKLRPCTFAELKSLEHEFEEWLKVFWEPASEAYPPESLIGDLPEIIGKIDAIHIELRKGIAAHRQARSAILRLQQLIARNHVREAIIESVKMTTKVTAFSDLSINFVTEAEIHQENRQRRLIILCGVLAGLILLAATIFELLNRPAQH